MKRSPLPAAANDAVPESKFPVPPPMVAIRIRIGIAVKIRKNVVEAVERTVGVVDRELHRIVAVGHRRAPSSRGTTDPGEAMPTPGRAGEAQP